MSKPIYVTQAMREEIVAEFTKKVDAMNFLDGKIEYSTSYYWPKPTDETGKEMPDTVKVIFSELAFRKQKLLVDSFSGEVAWRGLCRRDAEDPKVFYIDDILIFKQDVTGASVRTEQDEEEQFLLSDMTAEERMACRYHGHSHVDMSVSPSGTDNKFQIDVVDGYRGKGLTPERWVKTEAEMGDKNFYIFMIWNKRGDVNVRVFDIWNNRLYADKEVIIETNQADLSDFLAEAKSKVREKTYSSYTNNYTKPTPPAIPSKTGGGQTTIPQFRAPYDYPEEYDFQYGGYYDHQ